MRAGLQRTPAEIVPAGDSDLGAQGRAGGHREGQEVPGEYRDAVDRGYCESSAHRRPSRKRSAARGEPGAGMTGTPGSEVRAGETGRRQRRHRAPARPYDRRCGHDHAATLVTSSSASLSGVWSGRSISLPAWNRAPARTRATRCGPLTARQRPWAASSSLNTIASPVSRVPGPLVTLVRALTGEKALSIIRPWGSRQGEAGCWGRVASRARWTSRWAMTRP